MSVDTLKKIITILIDVILSNQIKVLQKNEAKVKRR